MEDIRTRGELDSADFPQLDPGEIAQFLQRTYATDPESHGHIALIAQALLQRDQSIHLSNERRVSKTVAEWVFHTLGPTGLSPIPTGCNSGNAEAQDETSPIVLRVGHLAADTRLSIRRIGKWATRKYKERVHLELVISNNQMFVVQLDTEHDYGGLDPRKIVLTAPGGNPELAVLFSRYEVGTASVFGKLRNISDFQVGGYDPPHRLFSMTASDADAYLGDPVLLRQLAAEIESLTGGRLVVREDRSDALRGTVEGFNLFRSDTVNTARALEILANRIRFWEAFPVPLSDICFIIHAFIPARSGAWAHFDSESQRTRIHALWGLPDGLQFLTPDEYEFDHVARKSTPRFQFKEFFLNESEAGDWIKEAVTLDSSRAAVLTKDEIIQIAAITRAVTEKLGSDTHIMFFSGIPEEAGLGLVLPWYRTAEGLAYEAKRTKRLTRRDVSGLADLEALEHSDLSGVVLRLKPEVEDFRNNEFVKAVADFAVARDVPVEIMGSPLAHAYYLLRSRGVAVFTSFASDYERVRNKQEFGKLVRDGVVEKIGSGGERTISFSLAPEERARALFGKLIEEGAELVAASDANARLEELSDVFEVVRSWAQVEGFQMDEIVAAADEKRKKRGGFLKGEILVGTGTKRPSEDMRFGGTRTFDYVTMPEVTGTRIKIPLGRFGYLAEGKPIGLHLASLDMDVELSFAPDGEFVIHLDRQKMNVAAVQGDLWEDTGAGVKAPDE